MSDHEKDHQDKPRLKSKATWTQAQRQGEYLEKLFQKIDKPVNIPEPPKEKSVVKAPKEFVRNVPGSSAGAGSGDFHVYRAHRRREYARLREMTEAERKEKEEREYREKIEKMKREDEERTAKKRAQRQKRKQRQTEANKNNKKQKTEDVKADNKKEETEPKAPSSSTSSSEKDEEK
ncbi:hypothetical protein BCR43DRAFT_492881 [Syncephalastrum racemosum]|uniref:DUF1168 domain protein n=1 Tax=Syncephalastrum racemosum TaxID=13706 RepID=A0A1X2H9M7_SYNRA|nr:hypothetical protein BCR43DRAFT_492881 [Syncephalastrum racemosum]